jgi:type I restriction enzyme, S subunit
MKLDEPTLFDATATLDEVEEQPRRFKPYPRVKQSGIPWLGPIPQGWHVERLRFCAKVNPLKSEVAHLPDDDDVSFVPMEALHEFGGMTLDQTRPLASVQQGYTYFRDGDIVIAKITPCFENGKGSIAAGLVNSVGFGTTELHVIRVGCKLDRRFAFYLTMSDAFRKLGTAEMYGAGGQKRVPDAFIRDFRTPLPGDDEQRAIVGFLDRETAKIDSLVSKKRRLIELLKERRTALISRAVTKGLNPAAPMRPSGIDWLGDVPHHWVVRRLKHVVRYGSSISYGIVQPGEPLTAGVPFVQTTDMTTGHFNVEMLQRTSPEIAAMYPRSRLEGGEVLLGIRASVGAAHIAPPELEGANLSRGVARIDLAEMHAPFVVYYLQSDAVADYWRLFQQGSTFSEVSILTVRELQILYPPFPEQVQIANWIEGVATRLDRMINRVDGAVARLLEYRSALISAAVTGKIDVRGEP